MAHSALRWKPSRWDNKRWPAESFEQRGPVLEHRNFWTMNPALVRRSVAERPWPSVASSERVFGDLLLRDHRVRFGLWGTGEPWIVHIGTIRAVAAGAGY